jgi:hypothetical protein
MFEALFKNMFKQRVFVENSAPSGVRQQLLFLKLTQRARIQNSEKQGGWQIKNLVKPRLMGKKVAGVCYLQSR